VRLRDLSITGCDVGIVFRDETTGSIERVQIEHTFNNGLLFRRESNVSLDTVSVKKAGCTGIWFQDSGGAGATVSVRNTTVSNCPVARQGNPGICGIYLDSARPHTFENLILEDNPMTVGSTQARVCAAQAGGRARNLKSMRAFVCVRAWPDGAWKRMRSRAPARVLGAILPSLLVPRGRDSWLTSQARRRRTKM
jgi:hypothetical protein